ncbi:MAG: segregation/condensation protein A [Acidobacteria bacterium]|nr:MAG: segregation/condensation protein A [Acidobacteriota bacterium]
MSGIISPMSIGFFTRRAIHYQVQIPLYQGPLDLLLSLIEKAELDITQLALAQVTDQFLAYLHSLEQLETEELSYFIVIATKLLYIKSQMLLPKPPPEMEMEEDETGEELVRQLKEYKQFRQVAAWLGERETNGLRTYLRLAPPPKIETAVDLSHLDLQTFLLAAQSVFRQAQPSSDIHLSIIKPKYSIKEQIHKIISILKDQGNTTFRSLAHSLSSRAEIITLFLALLELIKQQKIEVQQTDLFTDIEIFPTAATFESDFLESEFEE